MKDQELNDALKVVFKSLNVMTSDGQLSKSLVDIMKSEHRTIQQGFVRELNNFLVEYSDFNSDARNEQSVKFAKEVKKLDMNFPFI